MQRAAAVLCFKAAQFSADNRRDRCLMKGGGQCRRDGPKLSPARRRAAIRRRRTDRLEMGRLL